MGTSEELVWVDPVDYFDGRNVPLAVRRSVGVANGLMSGLIDPIVWGAEVRIAMEILCDAPGGDPLLALKAVKAVEGRFRRPTDWESDQPIENAERFACWATLIAEVAHRNGRYAEAVVITSAALDRLEDAAGGWPSLLGLAATPGGDPLARALTAVVAIRLAALRRARYPEEVKDRMRERTSGFVSAYLSSGRIDLRTHAFATQALFDEIERGAHDHVDDLRALSDETRGASIRSRATEPLVAMECLRLHGDISAAREAAAEAQRRLRAFGLWRHLEMVQQYGYLAFG